MRFHLEVLVRRGEITESRHRVHCAVTDTEGDHAYTWDAAGRLLSADHPLGSVLSDEAYSYDANGNRTAWDGNAGAESAVRPVSAARPASEKAR